MMRTMLFLIPRHVGASLSKFHSYHHSRCDDIVGSLRAGSTWLTWRAVGRTTVKHTMGMLAVMSPVMWKWLSIHRLHPGAGCISLSLSLNFSTFDHSLVYRISVQETVTALYIDYLPIQRNRDFVFSYSCYASQCGLLKFLRPLHFGQVTMFQMVNIDLWIQTLSKKLATQSWS
jgi:hypothetical protein